MAFLFEPEYFVPFESAWNWQRDWQQSLMSGACTSPAVWLLQHLNCYTLGRGATESNLLFDLKKPPWPIFRIDRGGEVTHHLPGQLVAYLVLDLHLYNKDLDWYLRQLEEVLIDVLNQLGLKGERITGRTGLWLDGRKVASIGIGCRRWITQHGLALNVNCGLQGFHQIIPCGLEGQPIASLDNWIPGITVSDVQPLMKMSLVKTFDLTFQI
tara:strand:- start:913 stop:1548 length:636 start_codon:yes stop_codon:yes gene_type:complete